MHRSPLVAAVLTGFLAAAVPGSADRQPGASGDGCTFTGMTTGPDLRGGVLTGGPYVVPGAASIEMRCWIVVAGRTVYSGSQPSAVVGFFPPRYLTYVTNGPAYVCTVVTWYAVGDVHRESADLGCRPIE